MNAPCRVFFMKHRRFTFRKTFQPNRPTFDKSTSFHDRWKIYKKANKKNTAKFDFNKSCSSCNQNEIDSVRFPLPWGISPFSAHVPPPSTTAAIIPPHAHKRTHAHAHAHAQAHTMEGSKMFKENHEMTQTFGEANKQGVRKREKEKTPEDGNGYFRQKNSDFRGGWREVSKQNAT